MALPPPWRQKNFWLPTPLFVHGEDGTLTRLDPRRRAYPADEITAQEALRSPQYLKAYNANPSSCEDHWGHLGRKRTTDFRSKPMLFMLSFLAFAFTLFAIGVNSMFRYPNHMKETMKLPDLTFPDWLRLMRLMRLKWALIVSFLPLPILVLLYMINSVLSILTLWAYAVLENSAEIKQGYEEALRQAHFRQELRQGRAQSIRGD